MMKFNLWVVALLALALAIGIGSFAVATTIEETNSGQVSEQSSIIGPAATKMAHVYYYDWGGTPHEIVDGGVYHVGDGANVILTGRAYYSGQEKGYATFFDYANWKCIGSKLLPSGKWVTVTTPVAIKVETSIQYEFGVYGPDRANMKYMQFTIAP